MRLGAKLTATVATALALVYPSVALACPYCAGRKDGGTMQLVLLGAFVFFPFAVVGTIAYIVKAGNRES